MTEVNINDKLTNTDIEFPPMTDDHLQWVDAAFLDLGAASTSATARAATAAPEKEYQDEVPDHPGVRIKKRSTEGGPSGECTPEKSGSSQESFCTPQGCDT